MVATTKVQSNQAQQRLMDGLQQTIMRHTTVSPMTVEDIVAVMAFCTGCAIGQGDTRRDRRHLRNTAVANLDYGMDAVRGTERPGIIVPH